MPSQRYPTAKISKSSKINIHNILATIYVHARKVD